MASARPVQRVRNSVEIAAIPDVCSVVRTSRRDGGNAGGGGATADDDTAGVGTGHEGQFRPKLLERDGIVVERGARKANTERIDHVRREHVNGFHAGNLIAQTQAGSEEGIGLGDDGVAIVHSPVSRDRILLTGTVVHADGAEIFVDALAGIVIRKRSACGLASRKQLRAIGFRPHGHVLQHVRVEIGDTGINTVHGQQALPRLGVRNHRDIADSQNLAETFVIAEQE